MEQAGRSAGGRTALGCLWLLVAWGAIGWFVHQAVAPTLAGGTARWVAAASALFLALGLSNVWHLARGYGQGDQSRRELLRRATTGEPPSGDGPFVVTGLVRPAGPVLTAPLSGVPCAAYQYRMFYRTRDFSERRRRLVTVYWGHASVPFSLDASTWAVSIAAEPHLADTGVRHTGEDAVARARGWVADTVFEDVSGDILGQLGVVFNRGGSLMAGGEVESRRDWRRAGATHDPAALTIEETVLPVGVTATAAGQWSSERHALVASTGEGGLGTLTVVTGDADHLPRAGHPLPSSALSVGVMALVLFALGGGLLWVARTGKLAAWLERLPPA